MTTVPLPDLHIKEIYYCLMKGDSNPPSVVEAASPESAAQLYAEQYRKTNPRFTEGVIRVTGLRNKQAKYFKVVGVPRIVFTTTFVGADHE